MDVWRRSGLHDSTIAVYLCSVRPFRRQCHSVGVDEIQRLTHADVLAYAEAYIGPRRGRRVKPWAMARNAMHAWSCALQILGVPVPSWRPAPASPRWPAVVDAYGEFRRVHRGVGPRTLLRDSELAFNFLRSLKARSRRIATIRVKDLDNFVDELSGRLGRRTVAGLCSSLRCFLRFLPATGRVRRDLATCVVAPRFRTDERPPRALPWESVRRILRAIPRDERVGRRDHAMFLLMAVYGFGAGEIVGLRLEDVDWRARVLRTRRPKTAVPIELPLLPAVARALASYLRRGRPRTTSTRALFVTMGLPHRALKTCPRIAAHPYPYPYPYPKKPLRVRVRVRVRVRDEERFNFGQFFSTSVLRHQARVYADRAGIEVAPLGAHVFRHSHATRQIDEGAPAKIVADILGHRRPSSISVYVQLAHRRLRLVALPVPR